MIRYIFWVKALFSRGAAVNRASVHTPQRAHNLWSTLSSPPFMLVICFPTSSGAKTTLVGEVGAETWRRGVDQVTCSRRDPGVVWTLSVYRAPLTRSNLPMETQHPVPLLHSTVVWGVVYTCLCECTTENLASLLTVLSSLLDSQYTIRSLQQQDE